MEKKPKNDIDLVYRIRDRQTKDFINDKVYVAEPVSVPNSCEIIKYQLIEIQPVKNPIKMESDDERR